MTLYVIPTVLYINRRRNIFAMSKKKAEEKAQERRILRIAEEIRAGNYPNARTLSEKLEFSQRTILRDIDYLRDTHNAPIEYDHTKQGYYYTDSTFFIRSVLLSREELETITEFDQVMKKAPNRLDSLPVKLRKIIDKLLIVLPEDKTNSLPFKPTSDDIPHFLFRPNRSYGDTDLKIRMAMEKKEVVEIEYWTSDNKKYKKQEIEPLCIFEQKDCLYVLAYKRDKHDKPGIYSYAKINSVKKMGKYFKIPDGFKASDYIKKEADVFPADNKSYNFEFIFPKEIASEVLETNYYHNQHIKLCEDGTVYLSFKCTLLRDVYNWVLGEGHNVKVLNPPELVDMMKREVKKLGQYYL